MTAPLPAHDVVVIGGGQAALAVGYHLRRTGLDFVLLDAGYAAGGAWRYGWNSLRLFSPAEHSSLPGWMMPSPPGGVYPHRDDVVAYLAAYERRYGLPVERPVVVTGVHRVPGGLRLETDAGARFARAVVSATGTHGAPDVPDVPGRETFGGLQLHSSAYRAPGAFAGQRVLVVGGGNSGAQVMAEVSATADATWVTLEPPRFLPDDVDGRVLFTQATARYRALREGRDPGPPLSLGDVVVVPSVRAARTAGRLVHTRPFTAFTAEGVVWPDGRREHVDAVIWCTGFRPALDALRPLGVVGGDGRVRVRGTRAVDEPRLWLVGYGNWTGFASATLIGVGRTAAETARGVGAALAADRGDQAVAVSVAGTGPACTGAGPGPPASAAP